MQALALLCTLHADGPATLRRLHRAGCTSLQRLGAYEPDELAAILEVPPAVARRLGREASSLADRLDLRGFGDREEAPEIAAPAGSFEAPAGATGSPVLDRADRAVLGRVLDRWRTGTPGLGLAESEAAGVTPAEQAFLEASPEAREGTPASVDVPQDAPEEAPGAAPREWDEPRASDVAPEVPPMARLEARAIDGLDEALCLRLAEIGIADLAGLVAAEPLALSRELDLAYARVRRLQFLAKRVAPESTAPEPASVSTPQPESAAAGSPAARPEPLRDVPTAVDPGREASVFAGEEPPRVIAEEPVPRKFWEPRTHARDTADAPAPVSPGVPSAVAPAVAPTVAPTGQPRTATRREGVALNWNFELHPPAPPTAEAARKPVQAPAEEASWGAGVTEGEAFVRGEEGAAGPFA